jgi:hypothetical protein
MRHTQITLHPTEATLEPHLVEVKPRLWWKQASSGVFGTLAQASGHLSVGGLPTGVSARGVTHALEYQPEGGQTNKTAIPITQLRVAQACVALPGGRIAIVAERS